MTTTRQFDALNRLTRIASAGGTGSTLAAFACAYNDASPRERRGVGHFGRVAAYAKRLDVKGRTTPSFSHGATQRVRATLADGSFWIYEYDALGRRIRQITSDGSSGIWVVTEDLRFVSDPVLFGRHIAELNATNNALVRSYVRGLDLSGTMDGAGGVGGLLWVSNFQSPIGHHFAAYDGNGNVVALMNASVGSETARYEYGPFGEPIRVTGPAAALNPIRFSTKRTDPTTDLVLYEYRAYSPSAGRWPNRDPLEEEGGVNLYGFVENSPLNTFDPSGLSSVHGSLVQAIARGDVAAVEAILAGSEGFLSQASIAAARLPEESRRMHGNSCGIQGIKLQGMRRLQDEGRSNGERSMSDGGNSGPGRLSEKEMRLRSRWQHCSGQQEGGEGPSNRTGKQNKGSRQMHSEGSNLT